MHTDLAVIVAELDPGLDVPEREEADPGQVAVPDTDDLKRQWKGSEQVEERQWTGRARRRMRAALQLH